MYNRRRRRKSFLSRIYSFAISWAILSFIFPLFAPLGFLAVIGFSVLIAFLVGKAVGKKENGEYEEPVNVAGTKRASERVGNKKNTSDPSAEAQTQYKPAAQKKSYGPEIDPIVEEGNRALSEMGRLYMSIQDNEIRSKINEIMRITDKITQDAIEDPSDIPQIKKFFRYYLPTTIKLLNSYDRMSSQGIEGENIDKSMNSINEMLDVAIAAYKKRLDSLFEDQALDIETDIDVMNQMLAREGLAGDRDFIVNNETSHYSEFSNYTSNSGSAAQAAVYEERKDR
ncbi:MAG: 5-bromo-4-chloroindolyl phosphate hydrolysis family protein [Eubacteriales bacterium]|nr:5-bromo-4-chloroindolyl phosphate hydrolysis family protein [Eubacteriales bacterium]